MPIAGFEPIIRHLFTRAKVITNNFLFVVQVLDLHKYLKATIDPSYIK